MRVLRLPNWLISISVSLLLFFAASSDASAQAISPPTNPVVFCGSQAAPDATSFQLVFDDGAPEALVMDATKNASCPASSTHSFSVAPERFTVGTHRVKVRSVNVFGGTLGPEREVVVGIAPGQFTIDAVLPPAGVQSRRPGGEQ